jgi:HSP20 family protein
MSNISVFDPVSKQMNKVFQDFGVGSWPFLRDHDHRLEMKVDVSENDKSYIVRANIPGVKKEDISVDIDGNHVAISAEIKSFKEDKNETMIHSERYEGKIFRSFTLDSSVDESKAQASYKDGLLELTLPKTSSTKSKRLAIN